MVNLHEHHHLSGPLVAYNAVRELWENPTIVVNFDGNNVPLTRWAFLVSLKLHEPQELAMITHVPASIAATTWFQYQKANTDPSAIRKFFIYIDGHAFVMRPFIHRLKRLVSEKNPVFIVGECPKPLLVVALHTPTTLSLIQQCASRRPTADEELEEVFWRTSRRSDFPSATKKTTICFIDDLSIFEDYEAWGSFERKNYNDDQKVFRIGLYRQCGFVRPDPYDASAQLLDPTIGDITKKLGAADNQGSTSCNLG